MKTLLFLTLFLLAPLAHSTEWIDKSSAIFFPKELKSQITASQTFPAFWWNFFVVEHDQASADSPDWAKARKLCHDLKRLPADDLTQVQCEFGPAQFLPLIRDWSLDLVFRKSPPSLPELKATLARSLAQASLILGNSSVTELIRTDPFESWKSLKARADRQMPLKLELSQGFLLEPKSGRILIPVQFHFSPSESDRTNAILSSLSAPILVGPHAATLTNEYQIKSDMHRVSIAGFIILAIFAIFLYRLKMVKLVPLFSVVFLGTALSAIITKLVFGSIHGLTLSFGAAIVGLAMDYAFQAALNHHSATIWKSNFCGFCTTTVGLVVVMFSSVPLLRQMMFFSMMGIAISYLALYLFFNYSSKVAWFVVKTEGYRPKVQKIQTLFCTALVALAFIGIFKVKPLLDLRQFDYAPLAQKEMNRWLYETTALKTPFFEVHEGNDFKAFQKESEFAAAHQIPIENRAEYIPDDQMALSHQREWTEALPVFRKSLTQNELKFFSPFWNSVESGTRKLALSPPYVSHLTSPTNTGSTWLTVWLPTHDSDESLIHASFPNTHSLMEVVSVFPRMLSHELVLMVPISVFLALLFHLIYYRRLSYATIALIPFFTGLGLILLASFLFQFSLTFISIIGLILVFGFSLDYGIFATDASILNSKSSMWTGISLAAVSTIAGFVPLLFCKHPVLKDLGLTLSVGGVGTYLGAIWGIPAAVASLEKS